MTKSVNIKVNRNDIFDYVVGNSNYAPIERCIDPTLYEVFDEFIYDIRNKKTHLQEEDYVVFSKQVSLLRTKAMQMNSNEIIRLCEELEEISPKSVTL
jgi:hypothetical protein